MIQISVYKNLETFKQNEFKKKLLKTFLSQQCSVLSLFPKIFILNMISFHKTPT